ncbi:sensor histidine kinase [Modestobacter sp. SSW1-42]|uniref:sensor histidine kinase n=1 Tax=Modestobacter sp. SSW1-42 TaxID=596372 RepID=UPI0039867634
MYLLLDPRVPLGHPGPSLHLVLDTVDSCIALLAAVLVHGRVVRGGRSRDLLLAQGLLLLALAGSGLSYVVGLLSGEGDESVGSWLPLTVRLLGALVIVAAALAGVRPGRQRAGRPSAVLLPFAAVALVSVAFAALRPHLPPAVGVSGGAGAGLSDHPAVVTALAVSASCFAVASVAFTVQSAHQDDPLLRWLGPAFALAAFSRVHYLIAPTSDTGWSYSGDVLRTGCYLLLLVGAVGELRQFWRAQPRQAVLGDRRRLARELHDGVIQELAYIRSEAHAIPAGMTRDLILSSCDRALDEARTAVHALGQHSDEALAAALHRVGAELAARYRLPVDVRADDSVHAGTEQRHALLRITREAVSNAVRHGAPARIRIRAHHDGAVRMLAVEDDGRGFTPQALPVARAGYGLISMRERATALPGSLEVRSEPGGGAVVVVRW